MSALGNLENRSKGSLSSPYSLRYNVLYFDIEITRERLAPCRETTFHDGIRTNPRKSEEDIAESFDAFLQGGEAAIRRGSHRLLAVFSEQGLGDINALPRHD